MLLWCACTSIIWRCDITITFIKNHRDQIHRLAIRLAIVCASLILLIFTYAVIVVYAAYELPEPETDKTPRGLANWAINAYNEQFGYSKGYYGQIITDDNLAMYSALYPEYYSEDMQQSLSAYIGTGARFADCIGLVKGYFWYNGSDVVPDFSIFPDTSAQDLFRNATRKGSISTLPDIPGIVLYDATEPHIGIYVGNGMAVDDRTFTQGTVYSNVSAYSWTNWIMLDQLDYDDYDANINNTSQLFGRQINSLSTILGFLPSDITAAMIVILVFIFALGVARIIL